MDIFNDLESIYSNYNNSENNIRISSVTESINRSLLSNDTKNNQMFYLKLFTSCIGITIIISIIIILIIFIILK